MLCTNTNTNILYHHAQCASHTYTHIMYIYSHINLLDACQRKPLFNNCCNICELSGKEYLLAC